MTPQGPQASRVASVHSLGSQAALPEWLQIPDLEMEYLQHSEKCGDCAITDSGMWVGGYSSCGVIQSWWISAVTTEWLTLDLSSWVACRFAVSPPATSVCSVPMPPA